MPIGAAQTGSSRFSGMPTAAQAPSMMEPKKAKYLKAARSPKFTTRPAANTSFIFRA